MPGRDYLVVRVPRELVERAALGLGLEGVVTSREVVERALVAAAGSGAEGSKRSLAEELDEIGRMLREVVELARDLRRTVEQCLAHAMRTAGGVGEEQRGVQAQQGGEKRRQRRGGRRIAAFCESGAKYQVVDLSRMDNPEAFIAAARRDGLAVLAPETPEQSSRAVLVCPGVSPEELLEAAKDDQELREALIELGYVYEPEKGRLEWVEVPQLGGGR